MVFFLIEPRWFFIRGGEWRKPPRKVLYKRTFGAPDQGQMLDMWESQTTESALRWCTRHIVPCHTLGYILGFGSGSQILDWESCDQSLGNRNYVLAWSHMILRKTRLLDSSFCRPFLSLIISFWVSQLLLLNHTCNTCSLDLACSLNLMCHLEVGQEAYCTPTTATIERCLSCPPLPPLPLLPLLLPPGHDCCHRHYRCSTLCLSLPKKEATAALPPAYQWQHQHENINKSRQLGLI